jgi:hypothetical protein
MIRRSFAQENRGTEPVDLVQGVGEIGYGRAFATALAGLAESGGGVLACVEGLLESEDLLQGVS